MSPTRPLLLAVAVLLSIIPVLGLADVYKWVDDDGVTHYSQQPPPAGTATVITPDPGAPSAAQRDLDADADGQDDSGADNGDGDDEQETIAEYCEELRERREVLEDDRPLRIKAEDGTLSKLEDEDRAQRLERIRSQLQDHCQDEDAEGGA